MSSPLSGIPAAKRRQLAATLGLFAVLFVAVGATAATGPDTAMIRVFIVVALVVAALLALMAWGVVRSVRIDAHADHIDAAIEAAVRSAGGQLCDCGHEHDPTELHVTDDPCERDGSGHECTHTCDTCVLATLRRTEPAAPSASVSAGDGASVSAADRAAVSGRRPSPGPRRPSPARH